MLPHLCDGDVVTVARVPPEAIGVGDVVCYESEGALVVHRVLGRDAGHFETKGDALAWVDRVPPERMLGRVTAIERRGRLARIVTRLVRLARRLRRPGQTVPHA